ncbi:MAG: cell division protein ZapE [Thermoflavifilum sp.]|nr:cell division protein ZapE [Thermoflavifilum sp.]MCL6513994.1 cell division protein ZapE [Alicyclobacillus sp.]
MHHIRTLLPDDRGARTIHVDTLRERLPELQEWAVPDHVILRERAMLVEYLRQRRICGACAGYDQCGKEGDMKGFTQHLQFDGRQLSVAVRRCAPYLQWLMRRRVEQYAALSGEMAQDRTFTLANFPIEQRQKYPRLMRFAEDFAEGFSPGTRAPGLYLFGPPGVGKTHLMLGVFNRLRERGVPCLVIRADSFFDRLRHLLAEGADIEPLLDACCSVPVLGIDEFAQERANDFTLEKLFRIVNHRFHAGLPTWFTSNFAPPDIYRKNGADLLESVPALRSRVMQMAKLARLDGPDARQRNLQSLT